MNDLYPVKLKKELGAILDLQSESAKSIQPKRSEKGVLRI